MKKLIVLSLVVAMASLASAGLTAGLGLNSVDGTGVLSIQALADFANGEGYDFGIKLTGVTLVGAANVNTSGLTVTIVQDSNMGQAGPPWVVFIGDLGTTGLSVGASALSGPVAFPVATDLIQITFEGTGTAKIVGLSASAGINGQEIAITSVPEPMTLGLLGLGGLFLRRKK